MTGASASCCRSRDHNVITNVPGPAGSDEPEAGWLSAKTGPKQPIRYP
jgi:hypothetical protein